MSVDNGDVSAVGCAVLLYGVVCSLFWRLRPLALP